MNKKAIVIGINDYQTLPKLRYARQDAEAIKDALKKNYGFTDREIILMTDEAPGLYKPTTKEIIQKQLKTLRNQFLDLFVFSFAGHGFFSHGERYLCPQNMLFDVDSSGFSFTELNESLAEINAKNTLMFFDCCQSGDGRGAQEVFTENDEKIFENFARSLSERKSPHLESPPKYVILNSCSKGECALESSKYQHGLFTVHLLEAMNRKFDTALKLVSDISDNVTHTAMEMGRIQTPFYVSKGDIHLPVDNSTSPLVTGDVFISYRHRNANLVEPIEKELQRRGISYFIDREGINYGMEYPKAISKAIKACKVLLFIWTSDANDSSDMLREVSLATRFKKTIIPYKIGDFDVEDHDALFYQLSPISYFEVSQQTHGTICEIVKRIQQALSRGQSQNNSSSSVQSKPAEPNTAPVAKNKTSNFVPLQTAEPYKAPVNETPNAITNFLQKVFRPNENSLSYKLGSTLGWHAANLWYSIIDNKQPQPQNSNSQQISVDRLRQLAKQGNAQAQTDLGLRYYYGDGVPKDYKEAVEWFYKAAKQGQPHARFCLGLCYNLGKGVHQDLKEAVEWLYKSAIQGHPIAQYHLGECYYFGDGISQNYTEAIKWFNESAKQEFNRAQYALGICYKDGNGTTQNYKKAFEWFYKAAQQGYAEAQFRLGLCYTCGDGVDQDYNEAVNWYRKAADQGNADAMGFLGSCYYFGNGIPQDYTEAVKWYRKAAEQNDPYSLGRLGNCYYEGQGVSQDYTEAVKWFRKAADQDDDFAQSGLGDCYYNGHGVPKNYNEAVKWYRKAAEQDDDYAQFCLGKCYENGHGVPKNKAEAKKWYQKAAEQENEDAIEALKRLK